MPQTGWITLRTIHAEGLLTLKPLIIGLNACEFHQALSWIICHNQAVQCKTPQVYRNVLMQKESSDL